MTQARLNGVVPADQTQMPFSDAELHGLQAVGETLRKSTSVEVAARSLVDALAGMTDLEDAVVYLREANVLTQIAAMGPKSPDRHSLVARIGLPLGVGVVGNAALRRQPLYVPDVAQYDAYVSDLYPGASEFAVPLLHRGELVGALDAEHAGVDGITHHTRHLMMALADIAAPSFFRLLERLQAQDRTDFNSVVAEMARLPGIALGDVEVAFPEIVRRAARTLGTCHASLWLHQGGNSAECHTRFDASEQLALPGQQTRRFADHPVFFEALEQERVIVADFAVQDTRTKSLVQPGELSMMHAPIRLEGRVAGSLCVAVCDEPRTWREQELSFLASMADFAALSLLASQKLSAEAALVQVQRLEAIGRLAGGIAHDFNNLLTVVNGGVDLLLRGGEARSDRSDLLRMIAQAGARAQKLTRQLMAFGRQPPLDIRVFDARELLMSLKALTSAIFREDIRVAFEAGDDPRWIAGDRSQLEQVVTNLMLNASDAMPQGGELTVALREVEAEGDILLTVSDSGSGISPALQQRIFEPFFTTKGDIGTGLGLSVSAGIVEQHNGELKLLSSDANGSVFGIFMRRQPPPVELTTAPAESPALRGARILLVEDEPGVRNVILEMLHRLDFDVQVASDAADALALVRNAAFDLLLTDVVMPDMRGPNLFRQVRLLCPQIRALFISGHTEPLLEDDGLPSEYSGYLPKPFTTHQLAAAIGAQLQGETALEAALERS